MAKKTIFVVGVSGTGKTTLAQALAARLGALFLDADDFHSAENVAAMRSGHALTDDMRADWLENVGRAAAVAGDDVVFACSALKLKYRDKLRTFVPDARLIMLDVSRETLVERMNNRPGHFMPTSLLDSQLAIAEFPERSEQGCRTIDGTLPVAALVELIAKGEPI